MDIYEQLRRDEGERSKLYVDSVGKATIGVGFNLTDVGLYPEEIDFILQNRVAKVRAELAQIPWYVTLEPVLQGVVENMAYNMGTGSLLHFPHFISALTRGDLPQAAAEMRNSTWATQVGERAVRLEQQVLTKVWQ